MNLKPPAANRRLDSWKEIALFFGRDERTVKRWEKERGLPIHRIPGGRGSVFAFTDDLAAWLAARHDANDGGSIEDADTAVPSASFSEPEAASAPHDDKAPRLDSLPEATIPAGAREGRSLKFSFASVTIALLLLAAVALLSAPAWRRARAAKGIRSIAILPLHNATGDSSNDYLADGMTRELIVGLGNLQGLAVAPRESTIPYKNTAKSAQLILAELHVDAVMSGEVTQSNGVLKMSAQILVPGASTPAWTSDYQGKFGDLMRLPVDVAAAIGRPVLGESAAENAKAAQGKVERASPGYEQLLRARYFLNRRSSPGLERAELYFGQAIAADSSLASAYAGLADCETLLLLYGAPIDGEKARATAQKALELDPNSAEAHTALGGIDAAFFWDWKGAELEFQQAIELDPDYALAHEWYSTLELAPAGRLDEALLEIQRAHELDPLSEAVQTDVGFVYYLRGQYQESVRAFDRALEIDPNFVPVFHWLGELNWQVGKFAESFSDEMKVFDLSGPPSPQDAEAMKNVQVAFESSGYRGFVQAKLTLANEKERVPEHSYVAGRQHALLGDYAQALSDFSNAAIERDPAMLYVGVEPAFKPLHSNPQFRDVLRRMGLQGE